jgi:acetyl esterase/lipase
LSKLLPIALALVLLACGFVTCPGAAADAPLVLALWPGKPPGDVGIAGEEKFFELKTGDGKPYQVGGKPTKWLTNVTKPTITVYRPAKEKDTGVAMLICPGGGYHNLGWDVEGEEVAAWLNSIGVTGIILKYRCPRRTGDVKGVPPIGPLKDAQRAVSLVRSKAKEWGIDPAKIGMVGFSAGGHLAAATAMNYDKRAYDPIDDIDKLSCRPDFAIPLYSGYLVGNDNDILSADMRASKETPPILLIHATDDGISKVENSVILYLALKKAGAPAELHVYATGGHGFGVRKVGHPCEGWTERCTDWLRSQGFFRMTK